MDRRGKWNILIRKLLPVITEHIFSSTSRDGHFASKKNEEKGNFIFFQQFILIYFRLSKKKNLFSFVRSARMLFYYATLAQRCFLKLILKHIFNYFFSCSFTSHRLSRTALYENVGFLKENWLREILSQRSSESLF